jgi:hypothetical protein
MENLRIFSHVESFRKVGASIFACLFFTVISMFQEMFTILSMFFIVLSMFWELSGKFPETFRKFSSLLTCMNDLNAVHAAIDLLESAQTSFTKVLPSFLLKPCA